MLLLLTTAHE